MIVRDLIYILCEHDYTIVSEENIYQCEKMG